MKYKLFEIIYNDGGWHSGDLPSFYYIAESKEDVIAKSAKYKQFEEWRNISGGDLLISEVNSRKFSGKFENLNDFDINFILKDKLS